MKALFTDAPRLYAVRQDLAAEEERIRRDYRIAQGTRNFAAMSLLSNELALVQSRQRAANYMEAGILAQQGNFDPLSQALSEMNNAPVRVTPVDANTVRVESAAGVKQVPVSEMLSLYRQAVDESYQAQIAAAAAEEAAARKFVFEESIKNELAIEKSRWDRMSEADRDLVIAEGKRRLELQYGRPVDAAAILVDVDSVPTVVIYDKNTGAPTGAVTTTPDPTGGGGMPTFRSVVGAP
jgi:hypothetical protein